MNQEPTRKDHTEDLNAIRGITWGMLFSLPFWLSFFGWLNIIF